ncbi:helicase-related protein [Roseomonas sp. CCTCC AB2023176]|uniref:helicase-related protein n=1 Tax=Roseomonas sp. CCTCC AB2023176 TaxID=3342640 RepID=UPI0035D7E06E
MEEEGPAGLEGAIRSVADAENLTLTPAELRGVRTQLEDGAPVTAGSLRRALSETRRPGWRRRLATLAAGVEALPARRDDVEVAVAGIADPGAGDAELLRALRAAVLARLAGYGTPDAALAAALDDLPKRPSGESSLDAAEHAARLAAEAFALPAREADSFAQRAREAERRRREERRAAAKAARETRAEEDRRLKAWEGTLVGAEAVPLLLGCTRDEAARWIRAGVIPVARRVALHRGGRTVQESEFDPAALEALRPEVPAWRDADAGRRGPDAGESPAGTRRTSNAAVARVAGLDRYAAHFATARALDRRIIACLGPTNSGKTYFGLSRLAEAESGVALGPLRLLAHEYREGLEARGVPTSLLTGEERVPIPGSRHVAATVEMCPFQTPVDVAVIDEAQMVADPDRGPAWTAAMMGVPARQVIVLGAPDALPMIRRIARLCGDPLEEMRLERMGPLVAAPHPVTMGEIGRGDAVIAFSRREVFALRAELLRRGRSVAVVYGALGPTVRRAEARRFREGEAEVLVATDAIGMGLNIGPLRRVVFSSLAKYDGQQERPLFVQEIKQIGGRAGRFGGTHAEGIVAVLAGGGNPAEIARALVAGPVPPQDPRPPVAPDAEIVAAVAAEIGTTSLFGTLRRIERAVLRRDDPNYRLGDLSTQMAIAGVVDGVRELSLMDRWTYALCPVDERDEGIARLSNWAVEHALGHAVAPPRAGRLPPPDRADQQALQLAERVHRRLVAWRWMAQRFPDAYRDLEGAMTESRRLNDWIEAVLSAQPSDRRRAVAGVAMDPAQGQGRPRPDGKQAGGKQAGGNQAGGKQTGGKPSGGPRVAAWRAGGARRSSRADRRSARHAAPAWLSVRDGGAVQRPRGSSALSRWRRFAPGPGGTLIDRGSEPAPRAAIQGTRKRRGGPSGPPRPAPFATSIAGSATRRVGPEGPVNRPLRRRAVRLGRVRTGDVRARRLVEGAARRRARRITRGPVRRARDHGVFRSRRPADAHAGPLMLRMRAGDVGPRNLVRAARQHRARRVAGRAVRRGAGGRAGVARPAARAVVGLTRGGMHAVVAVEDRLGLRRPRLVRADRDERAAAAHALGIDVRLGLLDAGTGQRPDQAAGGSADARARQRRDEPASRHDRPDARDRQRADAREQPGAAAEHGPDRCPGADARSGLVAGLPAMGGVVVLRPRRAVVREQRDVVMPEARGLERRDRGAGIGVAVEQP